FDAVERSARRLGRRHGHEDRGSPTHENCASPLEFGDCCAGSAGWRHRRRCRSARAGSGAEGEISRRSSMKGKINLSDWAIRCQPLVWFLMIVIVAAGVFSYLRLGRNEDPVFAIKTMVVQAAWPGATVDATLLQITDRLEKKLQETPHLDYIRSYTT